MAVLVIAEAPGATIATYDAVNEKLGIRGDADAPEGLVQHVAGRTDDGVVVVDVWESREQFERFFGERAGPALAEAGAPRIEPAIYPVHNMIRNGAGGEANVLVMIDARGLSPELYDSLVAGMPAHIGDGSSHPAVSHVAATKDGHMFVVDVWDSPESFGRFADEQIGPRLAGALDLGALEPRFVPVHNRIVGR